MAARQFIARMRPVDLPEADPLVGRSLGEWLEWAEAKLAAADPLGTGALTHYLVASQRSAHGRASTEGTTTPAALLLMIICPGLHCLSLSHPDYRGHIPGHSPW